MPARYSWFTGYSMTKALSPAGAFVIPWCREVISMRNETTVRTRHELAADGVLITSGLFALVCAVFLPLMWLFSPAQLSETNLAGIGILGTIANIAMLASAAVGPWLTWTLHGRRLTWKVVIAAVAAIPATTLVFGTVLPLMNFAVHPIALLFSDKEYAGAIGIGILAAVVYLWVIARAARATFFEYGGPVGLIRAHQASLIGIVVLIAELVVGIGLMGVDGSMAEALAFGMLFGAGGGVAIWAADLVSDR